MKYITFLSRLKILGVLFAKSRFVYGCVFFFLSSLSATSIYDDYYGEPDFEGESMNPKSEEKKLEELTFEEDLPNLYNPALFNLEKMTQDFVLATKQIEIPGYPGAFNPSIVRWDDTLFLSFRIREPISHGTNGTNGIAIVRLDEKFNPVGKPQVLSIFYEEAKSISKQQDPRLVQVGNRLFLVYNNLLDPLTHQELRRMYYVELLYDGTSFYPQRPQIITDYPYQLSYRQEKNWAPFDYNDQLLLTYSIKPHSIFSPLPNTPKCELFAETKKNIEWLWGALRGGTPALKVGDDYLAFFHSSIAIPTVHSGGKVMLHYFIGAYTFSSTPPFAITRISPGPIIGDTFYTSPLYKTWKPLKVVFPGGFVFDENSIWIVYGKQDFEMWVVQLDRKKFFESLNVSH